MAQSANGVFWTQLKQLIGIVGGGTAVFSAYSVYEGNERFYREYVMPNLKYLDPETTHNLAVWIAKHKLTPKQKKPDPQCLVIHMARIARKGTQTDHTKVWDREFTNPVGLAAGFDKDGVAVDGMLQSGFGFVEVGSVTPEPQPGNPKPRLFRLIKDTGVINRFGFNSDGHEVVCERLKKRQEKLKDYSYSPYVAEERNMLNINLWTDTNSPETETNVKPNPASRGIMGVNLGKNKTSETPVGDYQIGVEKFGPVADYLVINVSSPNTPGLRNMQGKEQLEELISKVSDTRQQLTSHRKPPLLVKIAPDLTDKDKEDITQVILSQPGRIDGLIVSNTTVSRPAHLQSPDKGETGGLSGEPLKGLATNTVRDMYKLTKGSVPIIGVGGVSCGQDAYDKIRNGASLVQLYSALVYQGPPVVKRIKRELADLLEIVAGTLIYGMPEANRGDPDETAPTGAVSSGSSLFANTSNHVIMREWVNKYAIKVLHNVITS